MKNSEIFSIGDKNIINSTMNSRVLSASKFKETENEEPDFEEIDNFDKLFRPSNDDKFNF